MGSQVMPSRIGGLECALFYESILSGRSYLDFPFSFLSLCILSCPVTLYVDQAGLELTKIHLPLVSMLVF